MSRVWKMILSIRINLSLTLRVKQLLRRFVFKNTGGTGFGVFTGFGFGEFRRVLEFPALELDNNLIENAIRPVALERKNYLFAASHRAAQNAAMIYSLPGSCKMQNINPRQWLEHTLEKIPDHSIQKPHQLLPGYQENL